MTPAVSQALLEALGIELCTSVKSLPFQSVLYRVGRWAMSKYRMSLVLVNTKLKIKHRKKVGEYGTVFQAMGSGSGSLIR